MASEYLLDQAMRSHLRMQARVDQLNALLSSPADAVTFTCANPPYAELLLMDLPRSVWGPVAQTYLDDCKRQLASLDTAASAYMSAGDTAQAVVDTAREAASAG